MEPDTALMLSKSETDGRVLEGSHAPVQEGYARTVGEDGDTQEGKQSIVKSYDYQVKQDIQEQSQRKASQKKSSRKRIQGPSKSTTQQQVIANIQIETTNRDTDQLHDQSTVVPVSGLGTVEIARNVTDRKETPEEKADNAAVFAADPTFMVDQKGYKYFVGSKDRQQMKSRAGRDNFRVFGSSTQMSNHRDKSNFSNITSPKDSQLPEASAGKKTPQNFEMGASRKIFSNTQIGFTQGMVAQMPASANNFMLKTRGIGQYFVAKKTSMHSPNAGARQQQPPMDHLKSQNPMALNCTFIADNPNYYFAGDQHSQETGPNRERLAARHDSLKSYSNSNHQSHVQSKAHMEESFRVTRKELTKVPGIHDSGSIPQHTSPSAGKLEKAGPVVAQNLRGSKELSQRTHSQSNHRFPGAPGFDSFASYKRDELGAQMVAPLIVVADPGAHTGTFASPKFSLPESRATDKSGQGHAVSHASKQSYEALFANQKPQQFAPQTKQVAGPGGFNSKIKKRTQSLMNYKHYLQNRCDDYQYNAVFPGGKPAESGPYTGALNAAKLPKNLSNDHHYKELQILKASGLVPPEKVTNTVRSGGSGVNTQRQTFPLGAQFKHLIDLQAPEGVMQSHMSNSQMQTLIHSQAKQQSGIDFSLQEIGEIKISNVPGASPHQPDRVALEQPVSQLTVGGPSHQVAGEYKVKRLTMNIQDLEQSEAEQGAAPALHSNLTVTTADNPQRSTVIYSPDGNPGQPSPRTLKNSNANTPQKNKRRQVLLSNSRGFKKEYGQSIEDEVAPRVAGARERKGKRRSPDVPGAARQLEPGAGSGGSEKQGTAGRRGKKQASLPKLTDSTNLQMASGSLVNIDQIISNADSQVSDNYVVVQGANFPPPVSDLEAQIQNLKQLQTFKNAHASDPQVAKIDLNYLRQLDAHNRMMQGQSAGASGRESFGASAAPTGSLHKQSALQRDFLKNQGLMGNLNLSSNRAVTQITQREIDHLVEAGTSYQGFSDPFELGVAIESLGSRGKRKQLKAKVAGSSRFKDEDLEDWRQNIMTDKLYFLSTASKKSRQIMQQSMPDFKRSVGPRIDAGNQLLPRPFLYQIQTQKSESHSHAHKNCVTPSIFSNEPTPIASPCNGDSFFKKREKSRKYQRKNLIEANKLRFMKQGTRTNIRRSQGMFSEKWQASSQPPAQPKEPAKPAQAPINYRQERSKSPRQVKVHQLMRPKSPPRMTTTKNADAKDLADVGFVENQKLGFREILTQSRLQFQPAQYQNEDVDENQGVSLLTQDLNEYLDVDWSKVDVQLYDAKRATSKFGGIPGGMPDWADQEPVAESPGPPGSPGLRMDRLQTKDQHLRQSMDEAKNMYRDVIRSYNKTLKTLQEEKEKQTIVIQSKGRNDPFKVNQCDWTTIVIEGVKNRPQPMRISFNGIKGEMICFVSSIHKQPSELLNQGKFYNQNELVFSTVPLSSLSKQAQPEAGNSAGSARRAVSLVRFTGSCVYLSIETSLHSPSVAISTQFGLTPEQTCTVGAGNLSPKEQKVPRPLVSKETAKEMKALLDSELQGFELIEQFIRKRFRSALEKHESLHKEVRKIIEDEMVASKYLRRVDQIRLDRIERKRNASQISGKNSQIGDDDSSIHAPISTRNMLKENVEMVDNYAEFELNRKLHQLITYEMRTAQSKERREQYLKEFRDSAIAFLLRNQQMKEQKRILQAAEDKKNRQEKFFVRTLALIMVQKVVKRTLWHRFKSERDAYIKFKFQNLMALRVQRYVRRHQMRLSSADKTLLPPVKNEIMYISDWGYAIGRQIILQRLTLASLAMRPQMKEARQIVRDFLESTWLAACREDCIALCKVKKHSLRVYQMKKDQRLTLSLLFDEQRAKLLGALENSGLPHAKAMGNFLSALPDECKKQVLSYYNFATERAYAHEFAAFVDELNELKRQQKLDDRFGWRQPYLQNTFFRKKVKDLDGLFIREGQLKKRKAMIPQEEVIRSLMNQKWDTYDVDKSGAIDKDKTKQFIQDILVNLSSRDEFSQTAFDEVYATFDKDNTGTIQIKKPEVLKFIAAMVTETTPDGEEIHYEILQENFSSMLINVENEEDLTYTPPQDFDPEDPNLSEKQKQELTHGKEIPFDLYIYPELQKYADKLSKIARKKPKQLFKATSFLYNPQNFAMRENERKERVLFALTQVEEPDDKESRQQCAKKNKLQESEIRHAQDMEANRKHLEAMPHRYATFPERPRRRFIPEHKLMHLLIFKALQLHLTPEQLEALFSLKNGRRIELSSVHTSSIYNSVDHRRSSERMSHRESNDLIMSITGGGTLKE